MDEAESKRAKALRKKSQAHIAKAEKVLRDLSLGEMERQIEQSRLMELAFNYLAQAAIIEEDTNLLKHASENASKWAQHCRAAATKRRNDEVPRIIEAMSDRRQWARDLLGVEEID